MLLQCQTVLKIVSLLKFTPLLANSNKRTQSQIWLIRIKIKSFCNKSWMTMGSLIMPLMMSFAKWLLKWNLNTTTTLQGRHNGVLPKIRNTKKLYNTTLEKNRLSTFRTRSCELLSKIVHLINLKLNNNNNQTNLLHGAMFPCSRARASEQKEDQINNRTK